MSTSTEIDAEKHSLSADNKNKGLNNINKITSQDQLIKKKEIKFKELYNWLQEWGYKVIDNSSTVKISGIEFQAEVYPQIPYSSGLSTPFYLEFQDDLDDGFIIRTTFELDKNIEIYLNTQNKAKEIELTYIEIDRLVLPLRISLIRAHPLINLYKTIFYDELKKQYFMDCINDLMNSMRLIIGKWDEKYYKIRPKDKNRQMDSKSDDVALNEILTK